MDRYIKSLVRTRRLLDLALAGVACAALSGCVILESAGLSKAPEPPPLPVNEVMTYWDRSIRVAQSDTGAPLMGVAGRVYLINDDLKRMVDAQGSIHVAIRDTTPGAPGGQYAIKCEIKEPDLKRLKKKDMLGDGYTLFVPFESYRPDIRQIEVQVCYVPKGGPQKYSAPTAIVLDAESRFQVERRQQVYGPGLPPPQPTHGLMQGMQQPAFGPAPASQPQGFGPTPR
jgi:hypothetical protein